MKRFINSIMILGLVSLLAAACSQASLTPGILPSPTPIITQPAAPSATASNPTAAPTPVQSSLAAGLEGLSIDAFFDQSYNRLLARNPELLTNLGLARSFGFRNDRLTDLSDAYTRQTQELEKIILSLLLRYDRRTLSASQQLTFDIYRWYLEDRVAGHPYLYADYPLNPVVISVHNDLLLFFTDVFPLNSLQDARDYITCLSQVGTKYDQLLDGLKRREAAGAVLPGFLIPSVLGDLRAIAGSTAPNTPFYASFEQRTRTIPGLLNSDRQSLLAAAEKEITNTVIPAYRRLADYFSVLQTKASNEAGIWKIPTGEAYYTYLLRHFTTTTLTVDQVHEMGKRELVRIQGEMRKLAAGLGYPAGESLTQIYTRVAQDGGSVSAPDMVATYDKLISAADQRVKGVFDLRPSVGVKVIGGPSGGYYSPPAVDGSRPGYFYASTTAGSPRFSMPTLAYHEAIPGHHYQIAIAQQLTLPNLRRGMDFTGYVEGWALYAERLMAELGGYKDDPYGDLGRLQAEAFRASRLVVDTGLHVKKWTFQQAVETMVENTGMRAGQVQNEVARYVSWPGQATAYYVGFQKILELRQQAQDALGQRFNLKEFHNLVLGSGAVPLEILEQIVRDYVSGKK